MTVSAARTVLQTGEYDFAWNLQVEDEILSRMEKGAKGRIEITNGGGIEHIRLQSADPWTEVDGERASLKTKHPTLSDPAVRQALALLVDKASIEKFIYGRTGRATANYVDHPERFRAMFVEAENPAVGEIAFVQVKSSANQRTLDDYVERFNQRRDFYARMIFAVHSPKGTLTVPADEAAVQLWTADRVARLAVRLGLGEWVESRLA